MRRFRFPPSLLPPFLTLLLMVTAAPAQDRGKAYLVIVNNLSIRDLQSAELRAFRQLMDEGCVGLMNTRTDDGRTSESAFVTIGAGRRARGGGQTHETYNATDLLVDSGEGFAPTDRGVSPRLLLSRASEIYRRRVGRRAPADSVLALNVGDLVTKNAASGYQPVPGLLGQMLRDHGVGVALMGNADSPVRRHRAAVAIAMDEFGVVPLGDVGERFLRPQHAAPFGISTNYAELREAVHGYAQRADFLVIETGDTARADDYAVTSFPHVAAEQRRRALQGVDGFLATLLPALDRARDLLIVVSPNAATALKTTGNSLTPILLWGKGLERGVARSATTRVVGLIANVDVTRSVGNFFGLREARTLTGTQIESFARDEVARTRARDFLVSLDQRVTLVERSRRPLLDSSVYFASTLFIAVLAALLLGCFPAVQRYACAGAVLVTMLPIISLLLGAYCSHVITGLLSTLALLPLWIAVARRRRTDLIGQALPITIGLLALVSVASGAVAVAPAAFSFMGFSLVEGSRFYGLGNELGGILIAAAFLLQSFLPGRLERRAGRLAAGLVLPATALLIGFPRLGANFGDMIAASAGYVTFMLIAANVKITPRVVAVALVVMVALVSLVAGGDRYLGRGEVSHVGRLVESVRNHGPSALFETAGRKLALNWRLVKGTKWTALALSATLILLYFWRKLPWYVYLPAERAGYRRRCPLPEAAMWGLMTAFVAELILNDSGIVGSALMASYAAASVIVLASNEPVAESAIS